MEAAAYNDQLVMTLENGDAVDGVAKVPQAERAVVGGGHDELVRGMRVTVR